MAVACDHPMAMPWLSRWLWQCRRMWSYDEKLQVGVNVTRKKLCQADPGCTAKLKARVRTPEQILEPRNVKLGKGISRLMVHDGPVEAGHSRNQQHNVEQSAWTSLWADWILSEDVVISKRVDSQRANLAQCQKPPPPPPTTPAAAGNAEAGDSDSSEDEFGTNPLQLMQQKLLKERKRQGIKTNVRTFWPEVRAAMEALSTEQQAALAAKAAANAAQPRQGSTGPPSQHATATGTSNYVALENLSSPSTGAVPSGRDICEVCVESPDGTMRTLDIATHLSVSKLRPDATCGCCGKSGRTHPTQAWHADSSMHMRLEHSAAMANVTSGQEFLLSKLPMSAGFFNAAKSACKGGLDALEYKARAASVLVGRDLGGLSTDFERPKQCPLLCSHLPEPMQLLVSQCMRAIKGVVERQGGIKALPRKMPCLP